MNKHEKKALHLIIDGRPFEWRDQYITGAEVRKLGQIPADCEIFLAIKKPRQDEVVLDDTRIDLARTGIEHFFHLKPIETPVIINVNGREKKWDKRQISYQEVVHLAFPDDQDNGVTLYTVTYKRGPEQNPEGTMVKGDKVYVKHKMIFNVTPTDKS
jgi:hypothetical protein